MDTHLLTQWHIHTDTHLLTQHTRSTLLHSAHSLAYTIHTRALTHTYVHACINLAVQTVTSQAQAGRTCAPLE